AASAGANPGPLTEAVFVLPAWAFFASAAGVASALTSPGPATTRRLTFSTTTCLLRPWLKLWRTTPVSVRGLSVNVLPETLRFFSPGFLVSLIPSYFLIRHPSAHAR